MSECGRERTRRSSESAENAGGEGEEEGVEDCTASPMTLSLALLFRCCHPNPTFSRAQPFQSNPVLSVLFPTLPAPDPPTLAIEPKQQIIAFAFGSFALRAGELDMKDENEMGREERWKYCCWN